MQHTLPFVTFPPRSQASTEANSSHYYVKRILWEGCGRMWKHLRERFHTVKVRVLHPRIPKSSGVDMLWGVPEGSRLNPTLFVADLIHELKLQFPNATITHSGQVRWIGGIFYVDVLCFILTDARELQMMINT